VQISANFLFGCILYMWILWRVDTNNRQTSGQVRWCNTNKLRTYHVFEMLDCILNSMSCDHKTKIAVYLLYASDGIIGDPRVSAARCLHVKSLFKTVRSQTNRWIVTIFWTMEEQTQYITDKCLQFKSEIFNSSDVRKINLHVVSMWHASSLTRNPDPRVEIPYPTSIQM
jgi:hypothetical protein